MAEINRKRKIPGVFLLPNLITTSALFSGFYSVIASINGNFLEAVFAILIAMILDGLDGRIARLTNTQTSFGAYYDSLSDLLCFGTLNIGKALPFFEIPQISILPLSSAAITSPLFDTVTLSGSVNTPFPLYRVLQVLF